MLDGNLDEALWRQVPATSDFLQRDPREGEPATEKTEVKIIYTNTAIHFGVVCYDSEPERIPLLGILLQQEADIVDSMPTGEGKRTVVRICSECHSLGNVVNQRNMASGWEAIIDEMTIHGAQNFADDRKMVVAYLDQYYGLDRSEREALMRARFECLF